MRSAYHKIVRIMGCIVAAWLVCVLIGNAVIASPEIGITTKSPEARKLFIQGRQLFENLRFDEARAMLSQAIAKDPEFALAHLYRALVASSAADFQTHLKHAVDLAPKASEGERLLIEAVQANVNNNTTKATELGEQLVQKFPQDKRAHQFLGNIYGGLNQDDKAIAEYEKAIRIDKDYAPAYNSMGYAYIEKENYPKAEDAFKNYIRLIPDEPNPHDSIADLYTKMGRYEEAIAQYKKALELNPKFTPSQRKIGSDLMFLGKYDEGRAAIRKAVDMEPTPAAKVNAMNEIAQSHLYQGDFEKALNELDASLKLAEKADLSAETAGIHSQKCFIYIEAGDLDKAETSLAQCRKVVQASDLLPAFKDNFAKEALYDEALIAAKRGNFETALAKADEHLARIESDNNPTEIRDHQDLLGQIYYQKGDYAKAIEHFKQGNPEDPYSLYYLALSESQTGDKAKATELLNRVASWNESGLGYALVRSRAVSAAKKSMAEKN